MSLAAAMQTATVLDMLERAWTPHAAQKQILRKVFRDRAPITFVECGRKVGKTELILYKSYRIVGISGGSSYCLAPELNQMKEIVWEPGRAKNFCPELLASVNNTDMRLRLTNGGYIKFDGSDKVDTRRGIEFDDLNYDEFKDFRPTLHQAMSPNRAVRGAPLLICGTPPEEAEGDEAVAFYDQLRLECIEAGSYFNFPTWVNPHIPREWLRKERDLLFARGETDVWFREYCAKRVRGGARAIFPMFDPANRHRKSFVDVMATLRRDAKKLVWQVIADPGTTTCFAVLFRAVNPYTKAVYRLSCIYERDQMETSTSRIVPRIEEMKEAILPNWQARGISWDQIYDEAAAWFATESMASFPALEPWTPTNKGIGGDSEAKKKKGLSLMKDQMLTDRYILTDRCPELEKEILGYIKDKNGKIPKKNDHLIDCDRYGNDSEALDLAFEFEPTPPDPDTQRRGYKPEEEMTADDEFSEEFNEEMEEFS